MVGPGNPLMLAFSLLNVRTCVCVCVHAYYVPVVSPFLLASSCSCFVFPLCSCYCALSSLPHIFSTLFLWGINVKDICCALAASFAQVASSSFLFAGFCLRHYCVQVLCMLPFFRFTLNFLSVRFWLLKSWESILAVRTILFCSQHWWAAETNSVLFVFLVLLSCHFYLHSFALVARMASFFSWCICVLRKFKCCNSCIWLSKAYSWFPCSYQLIYSSLNLHFSCIFWLSDAAMCRRPFSALAAHDVFHFFKQRQFCRLLLCYCV